MSSFLKMLAFLYFDCNSKFLNLSARQCISCPFFIQKINENGIWKQTKPNQATCLMKYFAYFIIYKQNSFTVKFAGGGVVSAFDHEILGVNPAGGWFPYSASLHRAFH